MATPTDLPRRQLTILSIIAESPRSGADIKREIESGFGDDIHRTTVHHHITELDDAGLVVASDGEQPESGAVRYTPTDEGREVVREYATAIAVRVRVAEMR